MIDANIAPEVAYYVATGGFEGHAQKGTNQIAKLVNHQFSNR